MQRYFLNNTQFQGDGAIITGDDAHHMSRVMRMEPGDQIIVCNEDKACHFATIKQMNGQEIEVTLDSVIEAQTELPIEVTIAHGLPKGDKFEWVIQKATECGASEFIPLNVGIRLPKKQQSNRIDKWFRQLLMFIHLSNY